METIGSRIRSALTRLDKSPKWLADEVGVSYETVRKWLAGEIAPKRGRVADVSRALGMSEENLMFGSDRSQSGPPQDVVPQMEASEPSWPFSIDRAEFDKLPPEDRSHIDAVLAAFVVGCLANRSPAPKVKKVIEFTGLHPKETRSKQGVK